MEYGPRGERTKELDTNYKIADEIKSCVSSKLSTNYHEFGVGAENHLNESMFKYDNSSSRKALETRDITVMLRKYKTSVGVYLIKYNTATEEHTVTEAEFNPKLPEEHLHIVLDCIKRVNDLHSQQKPKEGGKRRRSKNKTNRIKRTKKNKTRRV